MEEKNQSFRGGGGSQKNNILPKREVWTVCRFKGGLARKREVMFFWEGWYPNVHCDVLWRCCQLQQWKVTDILRQRILETIWCLTRIYWKMNNWLPGAQDYKRTEINGSFVDKNKSNAGKTTFKVPWQTNLGLHLKWCQQHGCPLASPQELKEVVQNQTQKACLLAEAEFQKVLKVFDVKERIHLYKMNFLSLQSFAKSLWF